MKKSISILAILVNIATMTIAQKNTLLIYGNLDISASRSSVSQKSNSFSLSHAAGYQFTNHWTAGVNLDFRNTKSGTPQVKASFFGAGPFIRYAYPLSNIFAVYGQLNTNFLSGKNDGIKNNGFSANLFPAIGVNLKNGFALNFNFGSLGYRTLKPKGSNAATDFGLSFGNGAGFGISKNFGLDHSYNFPVH